MVKKELNKEEKARRKTKFQMMDFYDALEKKIKRHRPQEYIPYVAKRLKESWGNPRKLAQTPPHRILNSIEASCTFYKDGYDEQITWNKFAKIMNVYNDCNNHWLSYVISENLNRFFLIMGREQFELQQVTNRAYMARYWKLFINNNIMRNLSKEFEDKYQLTMKQWFHLCHLTWVAANQNECGIFQKRMVLDCEFTDADADEVDSFFKLSSTTVSQIRKRFLKNKKEISPEFHFLIRSIFLERPIIDFNNGNMISPHPSLIFLHTGTGLYRLILPLRSFSKEFGKSFELYIKEVLNCYQNSVITISNKQLEEVTGGKSCDFLVEVSNSILLIECKATLFTADMFTDNAIENNNSTSKVAKGLVQIYTTAKDVYLGVFDSLGVDRQKPIIGIVVTFGEIPLANTDWYFENFFLKRIGRELDISIHPSQGMKRRPIVISVETLEALITLINNSSESALSLYDEKLTKSEAEVGEWDTFIRLKLEEIDTTIEELAFIDEQDRNFYVSMGISPEQIGL